MILSAFIVDNYEKILELQAVALNFDNTLTSKFRLSVVLFIIISSYHF